MPRASLGSKNKQDPRITGEKQGLMRGGDPRASDVGVGSEKSRGHRVPELEEGEVI